MRMCRFTEEQMQMICPGSSPENCFLSDSPPGPDKDFKAQSPQYPMKCTNSRTTGRFWY